MKQLADKMKYLLLVLPFVFVLLFFDLILNKSISLQRCVLGFRNNILGGCSLKKYLYISAGVLTLSAGLAFAASLYELSNLSIVESSKDTGVS